MKILFVIPTITSYYTFLEDITEKMCRDGHKVYLATFMSHLAGVSCYKNPVNGTVCPVDFPRGMNFVKHLKAAGQLNSIVREVKPDIIHVHFSAAIFTAALARRKNWPLVVGTVHGLIFAMAKGIKRVVFRIIEIWAYERMDAVWVLTRDDKELLSKVSSKCKVCVYKSLGLGCRLDEFDPKRVPVFRKKELRQNLGLSEDTFVFIFVGRQVIFKGFDLAVKAFFDLYKVKNNVRLLLVGLPDKVHPNGLTSQEQKKTEECSAILQVGWKNNVFDYLSISDVMVFPSEREGMPVCLMEALSMGIPGITLNSRGCRDVVRNDVDGLVVREHTVKAILEAMKELFQDRVKYKVFSRNALLGRDRFNRQAYLEEQLNFYLEKVSASRE